MKTKHTLKTKHTSLLPLIKGKQAPLLALCAVFAGVTASHAASTVTYVASPKISGGTAFNISVYDGKAGYAGTGAFAGATGTFGDGTVAAYYFLKNGTSPNLITYASAGTALSTPTNDTLGTFADFDLGDVWTTSDPGTNFSGGAAANYGGTTATISGGYLVNGTIDISGFTSGTIYVLAGGYENPFQVGLTMSGTGQSNLTATTGSIDPITDRNMYVNSFTFDNTDGDYETISYSYTGSANNRARFMGVVLDAVAIPEPSAALLGGLGTLLLLRRRR